MGWVSTALCSVFCPLDSLPCLQVDDAEDVCDWYLEGVEGDLREIRVWEGCVVKGEMMI